MYTRLSNSLKEHYFCILGSWDPSETSFAVLNKETAPDVSSVYLTVAADLVISQVAEPVRFVIETKYGVTFPQNT